MREQDSQGAWKRFREKIRAVRGRQKAVIARFVRQVEEEKLQAIRSVLGDHRR